MNNDDYFLRCPDKMPPKNGKKSNKANKPEAAAGSPSFSTAEEEPQLLTANDNDALDPALRQTIQEITANITKVINEKLVPLSQTLQAHTLELKKIEERATEAENRILAVEYTSEQVDVARRSGTVRHQDVSIMFFQDLFISRRSAEMKRI